MPSKEFLHLCHQHPDQGTEYLQNPSRGLMLPSRHYPTHPMGSHYPPSCMTPDKLLSLLTRTFTLGKGYLPCCEDSIFKMCVQCLANASGTVVTAIVTEALGAMVLAAGTAAEGTEVVRIGSSNSRRGHGGNRNSADTRSGRSSKS